MNVTINTDASFCPIQKVGGYAFWIVCSLGRIKVSGGFDSKLKNATDAELKCLANAVYALRKSRFNNGDIGKIFINSDCKNMFSRIGKRSGDEVGKYIAKQLSLIFKNNNLSNSEMSKHTKKRYELRHVKAHTKDLSESRSWVNDWCDKNAKIEMNKLRVAWD